MNSLVSDPLEFRRKYLKDVIKSAYNLYFRLSDKAQKLFNAFYIVYVNDYTVRQKGPYFRSDAIKAFTKIAKKSQNPFSYAVIVPYKFIASWVRTILANIIFLSCRGEKFDRAHSK